MQRLRDYLTKEGWKKDLEETLSEDRELSLLSVAKGAKDAGLSCIMTPVSYCIVMPILATALGGAMTYYGARAVYQKLRKEK
ncbi:hypothetical protein KY346_00650 [Candidatus Woesearchaeota archaeon]|nr:hypothetical protein [Candidatus Woesearchaeota archaeon]